MESGGGSHFFQLSKRGGSERIENLSRGGSENNVPILYLILIDFVTIFTTCDQFNILKCLLSKAKANNGSAICLVFILSCHKLNMQRNMLEESSSESALAAFACFVVSIFIDGFRAIPNIIFVIIFVTTIIIATIIIIGGQKL